MQFERWANNKQQNTATTIEAIFSIFQLYLSAVCLTLSSLRTKLMHRKFPPNQIQIAAGESVEIWAAK